MIANKLKLMIGALVIGAAVVGTTAIAFSGDRRVSKQSAYAQEITYSCTRSITTGYNWAGSGWTTSGEIEKIDFVWTDSNWFAMKVGEQYISGTDNNALSLVNSIRKWYSVKTEDGVRITCEGDTTRQLSLNKSWGIRYYNNASYVNIMPFTTDDYSDWCIAGCETVKGSFARECLYNLAYGIDEIPESEPEPEHSSSISTTPSIESSISEETDSALIETIISQDFSQSGYSNEQKLESIDLNPITIICSTNGNGTKWYNNGSALRVYGGGTWTLSGKTITKVQFTFGTGGDNNTITVNSGTYNNGTWIGNSNNLIFTVGGSKGNRRIAAIEITYIN